MKVRLQGQFEFNIELTQDEVRIIHTVSQKHYDATCRAASAERQDNHHQENFLTSWRNILKYYADYPDEERKPTISATWRQLDTCCKILEAGNLYMLNEADRAEANRIQYDFIKMFKFARPYYDQWKVEFDTKTQ